MRGGYSSNCLRTRRGKSSNPFALSLTFADDTDWAIDVPHSGCDDFDELCERGAQPNEVLDRNHRKAFLFRHVRSLCASTHIWSNHSGLGFEPSLLQHV